MMLNVVHIPPRFASHALHSTLNHTHTPHILKRASQYCWRTIIEQPARTAHAPFVIFVEHYWAACSTNDTKGYKRIQKDEHIQYYSIKQYQTVSNSIKHTSLSNQRNVRKWSNSKKPPGLPRLARSLIDQRQQQGGSIHGLLLPGPGQEPQMTLGRWKSMKNNDCIGKKWAKWIEMWYIYNVIKSCHSSDSNGMEWHGMAWTTSQMRDDLQPWNSSSTMAQASTTASLRKSSDNSGLLATRAWSTAGSLNWHSKGAFKEHQGRLDLVMTTKYDDHVQLAYYICMTPWLYYIVYFWFDHSPKHPTMSTLDRP